MNKNKTLIFTLLAILFTLTGINGAAQSKYFSDWEKGASPQEVGRRVAENFVPRKFDFETDPKRQYVRYMEAVAWYGALTVAGRTKNRDLRDKLIAKFDRFLPGAADASRVAPTAHVDYRVFGTVPIEIYLQTKDRRYLEMGVSFADRQWETTTPDGITTEARYWIDDMYMLPAIQTQTFRATKDKKYLDRAALAMTAYLDKLQQPNGLFFHAPDSPFYWSRGNGWFAAGMAELLRDLPKNHSRRARILEGYRTMMASLVKLQTPNGLWRQLLDTPESWEETSGTGMFAFALITGVKEKWLDAKTYGAPARRAWLGLVSRLDENGYLKDVCTGTNKGFTTEYYLKRERLIGDMHGQAPLMWSATALLR